MHDVVSLGSVNVDRFGYLRSETVERLAAGHSWFPEAGETVRVGAVPSEFERYLSETAVGGKGANQAVAASRAGADAAFLGAVGADAGEHDVLDTLAGYGVDVDDVARVDGPTGAAYVLVDETGENRIAIVGGANDSVTPAYAESHLDVVRGADALLLQNEIPAETAERVLAALDGDPAAPTVVFNPAPAGGTAALLGHSSLSTVVCNETEHAALADALADHDGVVVRTRGAEAVVVEGGGTERFTVSPPSVEAVDTTGAGDVFCGFLAARLAAGASLRAAVRTAAVAASLSTREQGIHDATPTLAAVEAFERG
jgi:ribokinase